MSVSLNNNKQRGETWKKWEDEAPTAIFEEGLNSLQPVTAQVLKLHYKDGHTFKEITSIINKSMAIVRNHHNRGIFKLNQYFEERTLK